MICTDCRQEQAMGDDLPYCDTCITRIIGQFVEDVEHAREMGDNVRLLHLMSITQFDYIHEYQQHKAGLA